MSQNMAKFCVEKSLAGSKTEILLISIHRWILKSFVIDFIRNCQNF